MNSHDVGRDRGGVAAALCAASPPTAPSCRVDTDRLYPPRLSDELHAALPGSTRAPRSRRAYGHDGFLIENEQVGAIIRDALAR